MKLITICVLILVGTSARGDLTNLVRETFRGFGTNNSSNLGNFDVVLGTFNRRAVGPRLAGDTSANSLGWSARMDNTVSSIASWKLTNGYTLATSNGCIGAWFWTDHYQQPANGTHLMNAYNDIGNLVVQIEARGTNLLSFNSQVGPPFSGTIEALPVRKWVYYAIEWHKLSPFNANYDVRIYRRSIDESNLTLIQSWTNKSANGTIAFAGVGNNPNGGGARGSLRIGMPSLFTTANIGDGATYPSEILLPPATNSIAWYVNPATGNDTNSGVVPTEAFKTAYRISDEAFGAGLLSSTNYQTGPSLIIDTSGAPLDLSETNVWFRTRGLNVRAATGQAYWSNKLAVVMTNALFTKTPNLQFIYQYSIPSGQDSVVVWEDEKWMNHPTGANFNAISNSLDAIAGSFWTDGSTVYVHPFGNTDPASDGKSYTRSFGRGGLGNNASAINVMGDDVNFQDCWAGKTCMAAKTDNDAIGTYVMQGGPLNGTNRIANSFFYYGSKHCLGLTYDSTNSYLLIDNVTCEQGSPYGSQTPFVSFSSSATSSNIIHEYRNCTNISFKGAIGSTAGDLGGFNDSVYFHNVAPGFQFRRVVFDRCRFGGCISGYGAELVFITNSVIAGGGSGGGFGVPVIVANTRMTDHLVASSSPSNTMQFRNCIFTFTNQFSGGLTDIRKVGGTNIFENCTFLVAPYSSPMDSGLFVKTAPLNLKIRNCLFSMQSTQSITLFERFGTNDIIASSNNVFALTSSGNIAVQYTNSPGVVGTKTFAQWQAMGFDLNSKLVTDARFDTNTFRLYSDSPAIGYGVDVGPQNDFTGNTYSRRNDAGAMQYRRIGGFKGFN